MLLRSLRTIRAEAAARWPWLILELVIDVLGVSLSFLLRGWREQRAAVGDERAVLVGLRNDLRYDAQQLNHQCEMLAGMNESYELLLDAERRAAADKSRFDEAVDHFPSYLSFTPAGNTWRSIDPNRSFVSERHRELLGPMMVVVASGAACDRLEVVDWSPSTSNGLAVSTSRRATRPPAEPVEMENTKSCCAGSPAIAVRVSTAMELDALTVLFERRTRGLQAGFMADWLGRLLGY